MKMWSDLILAYCKKRTLYSIPMNELYNSPLCINNEINRRLSMDSLKQITDWMIKNSNLT